MGTASGSFGLVAKRYAAALLDLADERKVVEIIEKDLLDLEKMLAASEPLRQLVGSPLANRGQQERAVQELARQAKFHSLTANFLSVLAQNRRLSALAAVIGAFRAELRRRRGEMEARVQTAFALNPAQTNALQEQLSKALGTNVTLNVEVKKDLLGGLVVTVGSRMIDDSVKGKLERLQRAMNSNSNELQQKEVG